MEKGFISMESHQIMSMDTLHLIAKEQRILLNKNIYIIARYVVGAVPDSLGA